MAAAETPITPIGAPAIDLRHVERLAALPPRGWTHSVRRRRFMTLALGAPGYVAVFTTPAHHNLLLLVGGLFAFAGALAFRSLSEPLFVRAEAAALWPPQPSVCDEPRIGSHV